MTTYVLVGGAWLGGWAWQPVTRQLREQTGHNLRTAEAFARSARKQQEGLRALAEGWGDAYEAFFSPFRYAQEGLRTLQRAAEQGANVTQQVVEQGVQQRLLVGHIGVERVGKHAQLRGQTAHGQAVDPLLVGDAAGRGQPQLAGQAGALPGAAVGGSLGG